MTPSKHTSSKQIMLDGKFNLRKWNSNVESLRQMFNKVEGELSGLENNQKVLGLIWNVKNDMLSIPTQSVLEFVQNEKCTKRTILSTILNRRIHGTNHYLIALAKSFMRGVTN